MFRSLVIALRKTVRACWLFYLILSFRTAPAVVFWQWVNQSFNALVNYTNRNAKSPTTTTQLGVAYVSATASAMITALGCKAIWQKRASPLLQVPEVFCPQFDFVIIAFCVTNFHKLVWILGTSVERFPEIRPKPTDQLAGPCVNHGHLTKYVYQDPHK